MQDAVGEDRHQHRVRHAGEADDGDEQQQGADRRGVGDEAQAFPDVAQRRAGHRPRHEPLRRHHEEAGQHGDVADGVREEAPPLADDGDEDAGHRRADHARAVEHRGVEGDGVHQIVALDHLDDEGLPRRHVEGVDDAEERGQDDDVPLVDAPGQRERRQDERQDHRARLRDDDDAAAVDAVGHVAAERRDEEDRDLPGEADRAEEERGVGEAVDQPRLRHRLHPRADEGNELAAEEETEVPDPQGLKCVVGGEA